MSGEPSTLNPADARPRPTSVRYLVVGLATLMAVLLYLQRYCFSFLLPFVAEDFGLEPEQRALLLSMFFWSYALGQVPSGWLTDRFGARLMLTLYIFCWTLFTGLMGVVYGFGLLLLLRFGCGLAQAGAYPTGASMVRKWVPFAGRGSASGIVAVGGRFGGFLAPLLTAYLLMAFVPVSVPSLLTAADLLDPGRLASELNDAGDRPAAEVAKAIRELSPKTSSNPSDDASSADTGVLLARLNAVLERPELYGMVDIGTFDLPGEARQLAAIPPADLTPQQIERRNRLLLEAAFPGQIRKIYDQGWRPTVIVYGVIGLLVAGVFWLWVRDRPHDHPRCNAGEVELIEGGPIISAAAPRAGAVPILWLLRSGNMWLSSVSQFGTNFGWSFLVLLLPTYLLEVHHLAPLEVGLLSSLPVLVGMAGMLYGGWLTDRLTRALGLRWGRGLPMALTRFLAMFAYLACLFVHTPLALTLAFCVVALATDLGSPAVWAFSQDVGGRHVGSVLGWGNMWGNIGAAVSPLVLLAIAGDFRWEYRFAVCAAAFLVSGLTALAVDARVPIVPAERT